MFERLKNLFRPKVVFVEKTTIDDREVKRESLDPEWSETFDQVSRIGTSRTLEGVWGGGSGNA